MLPFPVHAWLNHRLEHLNQRKDLLDAAIAHAVKTHGHKETEELRNELIKANASLFPLDSQ